MNIIISNANSQPIYEQISTQIKNSIIAGELLPEAPLPSIRTLAKDLRISVITTKRAYDELEKEGFINTVAGKGCYVAQKNAALLRESRMREIEEHMRRILALAPACNLSPTQLTEMLALLQKEEDEK